MAAAGLLGNHKMATDEISNALLLADDHVNHCINGYTAMMWAIWNNHEENVQTLLKKGGNPLIVDKVRTSERVALRICT